MNPYQPQFIYTPEEVALEQAKCDARAAATGKKVLNWTEMTNELCGPQPCVICERDADNADEPIRPQHMVFYHEACKQYVCFDHRDKSTGCTACQPRDTGDKDQRQTRNDRANRRMRR
jgi:hypothetical protein